MAENGNKEERERLSSVERPYERADWNCPWIKRGGGVRKALWKKDEEQKARVHTSLNHFYSEPHSIMDPPPTEEEIKAAQKKFWEKQQEEIRQENERKAREIAAREEEARIKREEIQRKIEAEKARVAAIEAEKKRVQEEAQRKQKEAQEAEERRIRAAEEAERKRLEEERRPSVAQEKHVRFKEEAERREFERAKTDEQSYREDSTFDEPPPLEQIIGKSKDELDIVLLEKLARAIQAGMEQYNHAEGYEPSPDELIDVLKNLENLAAQNPALYRAIVDQIKANQPKRDSVDEINQDNLLENDYENCEAVSYQEQNGTNGEIEPEQQNGYHAEGEDVQQQSEDQPGEQQNGQVEAMEEEEQPEEEPEEESGIGGPKFSDKVPKKPLPLVEPFPAVIPNRQYQYNKFDIPESQTEFERKQEMEQNRRNNARQQQQAQVEVVQNGQNNKSAGGDNKNWREQQAELRRQREMQQQGVISERTNEENGGLYPKPMADYDYPWAGSLKPVSNEFMHRPPKYTDDADPGPCPWAGSLKPIKGRSNRRPKGETNFDAAPWKGTLRHIKVEKVNKPHRITQFKKYPDEDAPNPYQENKELPQWQREEEEAQLERIRRRLKNKDSMNSNLINALMPKLMMEHSYKYEALGDDEAMGILKEIMSMKMGLNDVEDTDCKDDDPAANEEAEQIIRAITHGEISKDVYSQMADDLEKAAQMKRAQNKAKKAKTAAKNNDKLYAENNKANGQPSTPPPSPQTETAIGDDEEVEL